MKNIPRLEVGSLARQIFLLLLHIRKALPDDPTIRRGFFVLPVPHKATDQKNPLENQTKPNQTKTTNENSTS